MHANLGTNSQAGRREHRWRCAVTKTMSLMGVAAVTLVTWLLPHVIAAQAQTQTRTPEEEAARQRNIARTFENSARRLTEFDREGNVTRTIGERGLYNQPVYSADRTRIAVVRTDLDKETQDIWVVDVASGKAIQISQTKPREGVSAPVWSPDGRYVAYAGLRDSFFSLFRKPADGSGEEEVLYRNPGGAMVLTDWSLDGRMLSF